MPRLEDIMGGRVLAMTNGGAMKEKGKLPFFYFCNHILECVAGKKKWKAERHKVLITNSCATVSDEAFALLLMVNSWEKFEYLSDESNKAGVDKEAPSTMFTEKKGRNRKLQGWSLEGIDKYNKLCDHVKKDCESKEGKLFELEFRQYQVEAMKLRGLAIAEEEGNDSDEEGNENEPAAKRQRKAFNHLEDDDEPASGGAKDTSVIGTGGGSSQQTSQV